MTKAVRYWLYLSFFVMFICSAGAAENKKASDWQLLWKKRVMKSTPKAETVQVGKVGSLGQDLEDRQWQMIPTVYHQIYFQPTTDPNKITELYFIIDNLYEFLEGRSPAGFKPQTPIRAFIVPGQYGRSRCCWEGGNAMRTGDEGDLIFNMTSLLHEETHLFNMAFLVDKPQGWWSGEYVCQYFQERARLMAQKKDIKKEIQGMLPKGPKGRLKQLDSLGKGVFDEAFSAYYFFEEKYDPNSFRRFRLACLEDAKASSGGNLAGAVFEKAFGKDIDTLEKEWLAFYGWNSVSAQPALPVQDERLKKSVSYSTDKASVQTIIQSLAEQAGIFYNWNKSFEQASPECRNWVRDVRIENKTLHQAMMSILKPQGLTYTIEDGGIVLCKSKR